jgi:hypothetical protein
MPSPSIVAANACERTGARDDRAIQHDDQAIELEPTNAARWNSHDGAALQAVPKARQLSMGEAAASRLKDDQSKGMPHRRSRTGSIQRSRERSTDMACRSCSR